MPYHPPETYLELDVDHGSPCNWNFLFRKIMDLLLDVMDPLKKKRIPYQPHLKRGWIIPMWVSGVDL